MLHRVTRSMGLFCLAVLLAGCLGGPLKYPAYGTMEEALGEVLDQRVFIAYQEPFGENRALVLFRTSRHPGPSPTLLEQTGFGKWRMTDAVGLFGPLPRLGALSYDRASLGHVEEQIGTTVHVSAETHVVFGEVLDPAISWVELTLVEEGAHPVRATVKNGVWLVHLPPKNQNTPFMLRAGDTEGRRFAASVGTSSRSMDAARAPLVEYQDAQQGVRLEYPTMAYSQLDQEGRLNIVFSSWTITVERKPSGSSQGLDFLLKEAVTAGGDRVIEHGIRPLGAHQAGYLLETRPEQDGKGSAFLARYLVPAGLFRYEVTCATAHVHSRAIWEEHLKPVCDRVLATVQLEEK